MVKKERPLVSVVMPVYNAAHTVQAAIDSVLRQSYSDLELLICNDASSDSTGELLSWIDNPRVRVIENSSNLGEGRTRDKAINHARGEWLAFIDADDAWRLNRLRVMMDVAGEVGPSFIFDNIVECHDNPFGMKPWRNVRKKHDFGSSVAKAANVPVDQLISSTRSLIKPIFPLACVRDHQIRHSSRLYGADLEFFLKIWALGLPIWYIPEPMYLYRICPGSVSINPDRFRLLRGVLEEGAQSFEFSSEIQSAFTKKINWITQQDKYMNFVKAVKDKNSSGMLTILRDDPWVFHELVKRILQSFMYDAHRILHSGRKRSSI